MTPKNPKNPFRGSWFLPEPVRLVTLLKQADGNVQELLNRATKSSSLHDSLLFAINERMTTPGNEQYLEQWERLKDLYQVTRLERLNNQVLSDIAKPGSKRKLSEVRHLFAQNKKPAMEKAKTKKQQDEDAEKKQLNDAMEEIKNRLRGGDDCQAEAGASA